MWDAKTGAAVATLSGHTEAVNSAAFSPDGSRVVTASWDKTADFGTPQRARRWPYSPAIPVGCGERGAAPTALRLLLPPRIRLREFGTPGQAPVSRRSRVMQLRFWMQLSAQTVIASSQLRSTRLRAFGTPRPALNWQHSRDTRAGCGCEVQPGRLPYRHRVGGQYSAGLDARTGAVFATLLGHAGPVFRAAFNTDGSHVVTASFDKTARVWNLGNGSPQLILSGHADAVNSAAFSPDGSRVVTSSEDKTARIWNATTGTLIATLSGHVGAVNSAAFSPDGSRIVTASDDGTARVWNARTGGALAEISVDEDRVVTAAFSPDSSRVVTASFDNTAHICDARTGAVLDTLAGHSGWINAAQFSSDGSRVVTASFDGTARVWDAATGAIVATLKGHGGPVLTRSSVPMARVLSPHQRIRPREFGTPRRALLWLALRASRLGKQRGFQSRWLSHRHRLLRQHRSYLGCSVGNAARHACRAY